MTRFNLVVLLTFVFALGCNGEEFTSGQAALDATGPGMDGSVAVVGTGGASGTGGAAVVGTGGAPDTDAGSGGVFHGTGGSSQTGGVPGTGGVVVVGKGGTPGTGGVVGTGGSLGTGGDVVDACALVTHDNGAGQTWQDCVPLGTYDNVQATKACEAWCAVNGGCTCQNGTLCGDTHERVLVYKNNFFTSWPWQGPDTGNTTQSEFGCASYLLIGTWR